MVDKEKILAEQKKLKKEIAATVKEIILLSRYKKATAALLANLEYLYDDENAAINALHDDDWAKNNFGADDNN